MQLFTGKQYLAIDIANNFGLDKEDWNVRLDWFNRHINELEDLIYEAEEPALYYASVQAYRATERGEATGYPISLDATSSGLQILAVLMGDREAAKLCNVVSTGHREDAYTGVYNYMLEQAGENSKINRKDTKQAIMTALYGSTAKPKEVFGEGEMLNIFYGAMETKAPAVWELNKAFLDMWDDKVLSHDWVMPDGFNVHIKVMARVTETVNFLHQPFDTHRNVNMAISEGRSLSANTVHSIDGMIVREMVRRCNYDAFRINMLRDMFFGTLSELSKFGTDIDSEHDRMVMFLSQQHRKSGYLSARILDHISINNAGHIDRAAIMELLSSLPAKPFEVIAVHDCFRCLPNYGNDLRRQYNRQLFEIGRSNMLNFIVGQLLGREVAIGKLDPTMHNDILDTEYALS